MRGEPLQPCPKPAKRQAVVKKATSAARTRTRLRVVAEVWRRDKGVCTACGVPCVRPRETYPTDPRRGEVHDVLLRSLGGNPLDVANNQLLCHRCHFGGKSGAHIGRNK